MMVMDLTEVIQILRREVEADLLPPVLNRIASVFFTHLYAAANGSPQASLLGKREQLSVDAAAHLDHQIQGRGFERVDADSSLHNGTKHGLAFRIGILRKTRYHIHGKSPKEAPNWLLAHSPIRSKKRVGQPLSP